MEQCSWRATFPVSVEPLGLWLSWDPPLPLHPISWTYILWFLFSTNLLEFSLQQPYVISLALALWPWSKLNMYSLICFLIFKKLRNLFLCSTCTFYSISLLSLMVPTFFSFLWGLRSLPAPLFCPPRILSSGNRESIRCQYYPQRWRFNCRYDAASSENSACWG